MGNLIQMSSCYYEAMSCLNFAANVYTSWYPGIFAFYLVRIGGETNVGGCSSVPRL